MFNREREPEYIESKLNTKMLNYQEYYMSMSEKVTTILISILAGGSIGLIFYGWQFLDEEGMATTQTYIGNVVIFLLVGLIVSFVFLPIREKQLKAKRDKELINQFREFLASLSNSLSSGKNVEDSLSSAYDDLKLQFSESGYMTLEVREIINGLRFNRSLKEMMDSLGERSGNPDIQSFSTVFVIAYETGASIADIVRRTSTIISDKIEITGEIETAIASNKMQFNCMMVIPVLMVLMLRNMSSSFAASFSTIPGVIGMTVGLLIFYGAYVLGQKIMSVEG